MEKFSKLKDYIKSLEKVYVAFSGGVDSTFLAKICSDILGENAVLISVISPLLSEIELEDIKSIVDNYNFNHKKLFFDIDNKIFTENPSDRCYHCKKLIFSSIKKEAEKDGVNFILDGSNIDDLSDYRPGLKALKELEIRELSQKLNLPTWNKPAMACLATRFPTGCAISKENLFKIQKAEYFLKESGISQFRVRFHNEIARIEVPKDELHKFFDVKFMESISKKIKDIGFKYVALELSGYKMGNMN